jgi:GT2 family glycosyltransferase
MRGTEESMNQPLVSVIVVTWNGKPLLEKFMPSVVGMSYPNYEVVVVDNASSDGSAEFLEKAYPAVRVVKHSVNDGTAEGSNVGARAARGEYLFFISNDMWLEPDLLDRIVPHLAGDQSVGIATVKMRRITAAGARLNEIDSVGANVDVFGFPESRGILEQDSGQYDAGPAEVFFSFGGAMLIRRDLFWKAGGYDPEFFTLTDDIDLSWRVRLLGFKVVAEPRAVLYHRVSATLDTPAFKRAHRRFLSERNTIRMLLKNYGARSLMWIMPLDLAFLSMEGLFFLCVGQWRLAGSGPRAVLWNLRRLPGTLRLRRAIQSVRTVPDRTITAAMLPGSAKWRVFRYFMRSRGSPSWAGYFGKRRPQAPLV